ncbi:replication protein A 70 kDa DNA-binding subunit B [Striga asiatica]|uniref:Replication protein A 70 kDa DNA-binding subunit B n=1 Tax=Striga asiatica TaxID=4170 RepID=A0A5A7P675_STRAF|nr:replication protein A 70 kDa DNA-binding subunit B [Striga asiatica]
MVNENTPSSSQPTGKHKKMCQEILDDIAAEPFELTKSKKCPYCGALKFQYETKASENLQLYFHDTEHEIANRFKACPRISESIIEKTVPEVDQRVYNKPQTSQVTMSRIYLPIKEITEATNNWTALIQVVERPPIHQSKNDSTMHYRRYLFTDEEGTKVAAVVYNNVIDEFTQPLLMPYKRYYVSGAKVRPEIPLYQVGDYKYKWTLVKGTNVEDYEEPMPPQLPCSIEIHQFANLHKYADTENPRNLLAVIVHAFPKRTVGTNTTREVIVINEEMKPMILTLWNQFEKDDDKIERLKSIYSQYLLQTKTCWVSGKMKLASDAKSLWAATCGNCRKNYNMPPNTAMKCRSCQADTYVEARCRIPMAIKDETGTIYAIIYGTDAERIIPFSGNDLYEAEKNGQNIKGEIEAVIEKHSVVCFIKYTESGYHTILKLYTADHMNTEKNMHEEQLSKKDTASSSSAKVVEKQLFTPTLKNVLQSVAMKIEKDPTIGSSEPLVKKRIYFETQPIASSSITTATPSKQASPKPSQFNLETHKDLPASPSKKSRPKMD